MTVVNLLFDYAAEVLAFDFKGAEVAPPPAPPAPDVAERLAGRCAAAFERSGKARLVLLGLGSGAVAEILAGALPGGTLVVCDQDLPLARALRGSGRLGWWRREGPALLALDASPWALLLLLDRAGLALADTFVLPNPELPPAAKARLKALELLLTRSKFLPPPTAVPAPRLSVAAILSPAEPDLQGFFAQMPDWLHELVLIWDADALPRIAVPERFLVWQAARPLERDFSAQRNAMLAACSGDWVLYLDADERFSEEAWAALSLLCADPLIAGWHFPRVTPYPAPGKALVGFGLWPDIQLRLFRRTSNLRFVNSVHERLTGLVGPQALALDMEIEHLSRLRKDDDELRRKLAGFDAAGAGNVRHALSEEYPSLPRDLLSPGRALLPRGLQLPPDIA
ncbi:MAG: glycosyl transferase family 2 [Humidesulfovibrio sp.]|uniref:glycosyl transferase family 2 n=1 Tax=Humidesulfovibrio sp. TaxID=2910988 RepID=UPI00273696A9|nr:glycosyl transferase family 2 [Humidesulfovibrio sp.]MDP2848680.1 glycosyl transferase family 2 [Humidesulfovibrio sp.]